MAFVLKWFWCLNNYFGLNNDLCLKYVTECESDFFFLTYIVADFCLWASQFAYNCINSGENYFLLDWIFKDKMRNQTRTHLNLFLKFYFHSGVSRN